MFFEGKWIHIAQEQLEGFGIAAQGACGAIVHERIDGEFRRLDVVFHLGEGEFPFLYEVIDLLTGETVTSMRFDKVGILEELIDDYKLLKLIDPRSQQIAIPCKFGTLTASVFEADEEYSDIAIDLEKPDGAGTQVCIAGTWEREPNIHVHVWDGDSECSTWSHFVKPDGDYCY